MPTYTFDQGEDKLIEVKIVDNGNVVDLSLANDIYASLICSNVIKKNYSLNVKAEYGELALKDGTTDTIVIKLLRADTKVLDPGNYSIHILTSMPDDDFLTKVTEYKFINYIKLDLGLMKNLII